MEGWCLVLYILELYIAWKAGVWSSISLNYIYSMEGWCLVLYILELYIYSMEGWCLVLYILELYIYIAWKAGDWSSISLNYIYSMEGWFLVLYILELYIYIAWKAGVWSSISLNYGSLASTRSFSPDFINDGFVGLRFTQFYNI